MKQAPSHFPSQNVQTSTFDLLALTASAGSLAAMNTILRNLPVDFSLPVIVMQHLDAADTGIVEIYGRNVPFSVEWAMTGSSLAPHKVLVCPPKSFLELLPDGTCLVTPYEHAAPDQPIDRFLASAARSFGERTIGVILTGMENDGVLGARQLHRAGGCVLVQNDAEYPELPNAVIQSGAVDIVLPLEKIAPVLVGLAWGVMQNAKAEESLHASEKKYRTLFNSINDRFELLEIVRDETGKPRDVKVLDVNQAYERQAEMRAEQVIGLRWSEIEPDIQPYWYEKVFKVAETGNPDRYDIYSKKQGKIFDVYFFRFAQDQVGGLFRDITESRHTEEALRGSEEKFRTLFETMDDGFAVMELICDEHGRAANLRCRELNSRFASIIGLARENAIGRLMSEMVYIDEEWISTYQIVVSTGEKVHFEYYHPALQRWFDVAVFSYGGNLFANIFHDITERKRAEEALRASEEVLRENKQKLQLLNETLEQKVQEKTAEVRRLASDLIKVTQRERQRISHILHDDLQQRIYAIQMQMSFLYDELETENQAARKEVAGIEKELNDILKITRHLSIDLSPPILREEGLSQAVSWLSTRMWQQYGLPIELQADGPFIIANENLHVLLFNCIRELLFNAVKHAEASRAGVVLQRSDAGLRIEVYDDGKGFSTGTSEEKTGEDSLPFSLGLPSIRHQLSLFGGDMQIHSKPRAGTRIVLTVPVQEPG